MLFFILDYHNHMVLVGYYKEQCVFLINFNHRKILLKRGVLVALRWIVLHNSRVQYCKSDCSTVIHRRTMAFISSIPVGVVRTVLLLWSLFAVVDLFLSTGILWP